MKKTKKEVDGPIENMIISSSTSASEDGVCQDQEEVTFRNNLSESNAKQGDLKC